LSSQPSVESDTTSDYPHQPLDPSCSEPSKHFSSSAWVHLCALFFSFWSSSADCLL